ncbi:MAG: outer membrane beta-barrel protein [Nitrospiraceae bacterium]|nr:outer membrane beta-barrel protein [Nitrospiraceae bacterium]
MPSLKNLPGNIHVGKLKIHPSLKVSEEYRSNIFDEADHEKDDEVTTVSPGVTLQLPFSRHYMELDYHSEIIRPQRFSDEYETTSHYVNTLFNFNFDRLSLVFGDNWAKDSTPPDYEGDIRNDYKQNMSFFDIYYKLADRYQVKLFYKNEFRHFDSYHLAGQFDPQLDNYSENTVGITGFYRILPLTSVLLEYEFNAIDNEDKDFPSTDSNSHHIWVGLKWQATAKIVGTIKGGLVTRQYDGPSDDWTGFGMQVNVDYKFFRRTTFSFMGARQLLDTSVTDVGTKGQEGWYGTYYVSTGGTFSIKHEFPWKLTISTSISYFKDNYQEKGLASKKRNDDRVAAGVGLSYKIRDYFICSVGYKYTIDNSNIDVEDYRDNRIIGTISIPF